MRAEKAKQKVWTDEERSLCKEWDKLEKENAGLAYRLDRWTSGLPNRFIKRPGPPSFVSGISAGLLIVSILSRSGIESDSVLRFAGLAGIFVLMGSLLVWGYYCGIPASDPNMTHKRVIELSAQVAACSIAIGWTESDWTKEDGIVIKRLAEIACELSKTGKQTDTNELIFLCHLSSILESKFIQESLKAKSSDCTGV